MEDWRLNVLGTNTTLEREMALSYLWITSLWKSTASQSGSHEVERA